MSAPPAAPPVDPGVPVIMPFPAFDHLLGTTYGVQLAGLFVSCGLFGVFALQVGGTPCLSRRFVQSLL
ncbi:hypothetical protein PM082_013598 [Marasmius tenuissimus]|nr:hypothetical protein PM082_013598 [Marasmius tenuissimus]